MQCGAVGSNAGCDFWPAWQELQTKTRNIIPSRRLIQGRECISVVAFMSGREACWQTMVLQALDYLVGLWLVHTT